MFLFSFQTCQGYIVKMSSKSSSCFLSGKLEIVCSDNYCKQHSSKKLKLTNGLIRRQMNRSLNKQLFHVLLYYSYSQLVLFNTFFLYFYTSGGPPLIVYTSDQHRIIKYRVLTYSENPYYSCLCIMQEQRALYCYAVKRLL